MRGGRGIVIGACTLFLLAALAVVVVAVRRGAGGVSFEGLEAPSRVEIGEEFSLSVLLRPGRIPPKDYNLFIHFRPRDAAGPPVNADVTLPLPLRKLLPGETVRLGPFRCAIPVGRAAGDYVVEAGLFYSGRDIFGKPRWVRVPWSNKAWRNWDVGGIEAGERKPRSYSEDAFGGKGYAVGVAGPLDKIFPGKDDYRGPVGNAASLFAARNEHESFQVVVITGDEGLAGVRVEAGGLSRKGGGGAIGEENISVRRVGYVETREPYYNVTRSGDWPDPLVPQDDYGVLISRGRVQPFWVDLRVPPGTPPGRYEGAVEVRPAGRPPTTVTVVVNVWDFSLPSRPSLDTGFDFYEFIVRQYCPRAEGETEGEWRKRLAGIYRRYYLDMLGHRISPIHNVGNPRLVSSRDGEYRLDFTEFGEKVDFYSAAGQTVFGIAKEARVDPERGVWSKSWYGFSGPEAVREVFRAYGDYLEKRGWLGRAYTYIIDESYTGVRSLTRLIHDGHPGIRNLLTHTPRDGYPDVDIWCVRLNNFDEAVAKRFRREGKEIWTYVASPTRPFPTIILDSPSLETRVLPWICWRYEIRGLLYWCVNYWFLSNPWNDAMTWPDQNGNGSLYYPGPDGPVGSIRLEVLRDGMEDYEYLRAYGALFPEEERKGVVGCVVSSTWEYARSPEELLARRRELGEKINKQCSMFNDQ